MFLLLKYRSKPGVQTGKLSDETLVAGYLRTGNKDLIATLFERYTPLVYGICLRYLRDKDQSKDAVMEIFESLFEKLAIHHVISFKNWLYSVSRNHCLMMLRKAANYDRSKQRSLTRIASEMSDTADAGQEESLIRNERIIHNAVESLNAEQRLCVSLMYLEDKSYKDITALTGFTMNEVKSHIQNGKRNLKNFLLSRHDLF